MSELPFALRKGHKTNAIWMWKKRGLIETDERIVEIYEGLIRCSNCELCGKVFKSSFDKMQVDCSLYF